MGTLNLDKTFNLIGKRLDNIGGDDIVMDVIVQSGGKIITAGVTEDSSGKTDFYLRRYNRDGSLDTSTLFNANTASSASRPALSGDQRRDLRAIFRQGDFIYIIGNLIDERSGSIALPSKIFLAKYTLSDGVLDQSFNLQGSQPGFSVFGTIEEDYEALGAVVQSDGKIVITGSIKRRILTGSETTDQDLVLLRFNSNGSIDTTFGEGTGSQRSGRVSLNIGVGDVGNSVKLQKIGSEERIIVAGQTKGSLGTDFVLARYTTNGDLDTSFGSGGKTLTDFGGLVSPIISANDIARDCIVLADNKILVVGSTKVASSTNGNVAIARYLSNGLIDTTFGTDANGTITRNVSSEASGNDFAAKLIRQPSGKILILGSATGAAVSGTTTVSTALDTVLVQLNEDGTIDTSFGNNGVQITPVADGEIDDLGSAITVDSQDNSVVVVGGSNSSSSNSLRDSFIVKYEGQTKASTTPDFNGDGRRDFIWRNRTAGDGRALAWFMGGTNGTTLLGGDIFTTTMTDQNWQIVSSGDFNRDGKDDLLWRNASTGRNLVWFMNGVTKTGEKAIIDSQGADILVQGNDWEIKGSADFNKDGYIDLLWRNKVSGDNVVWNLTGADGTTAPSTSSIGPSFTSGWDIRAINDFNRDGNVDIVWRNSVSGNNVIWYLGGATGTVYQSETSILGRTDQNWNIVGSGDFNKDGEADLLWRNSAGGQNQVWLLGGTSILTPANSSYSIDAPTVPTEWQLL
jgi:uncharacterized delta-60 repeat protein